MRRAVTHSGAARPHIYTTTYLSIHYISRLVTHYINIYLYRPVYYYYYIYLRATQFDPCTATGGGGGSECLFKMATFLFLYNFLFFFLNFFLYGYHDGDDDERGCTFFPSFLLFPFFLSFVYSGRAEISFTVSPAYGNMTETAVTKVDRRWVSARCWP